ncbi:MAG: FdtA/QdtA family cupin domain-containing protein [Bacteroidales bacterium]|nr:FdtA/QdtA family cupin domain-containing protein [Bacteroidales bacterium]
MKSDIILPCGVKVIQLHENVDDRGQLSVAEGMKEIPFEIRRVFWISGVPQTKTRGGHAHWSCHEAVFAVTGGFEIEVDDGQRCCTLTLDEPNKGVVIPAGVWCELRHFRPRTVCVVMASQEYDATGYVNDRDQWLKKLGCEV